MKNDPGLKEKMAHAVQWGVYLLASLAMGLVWLPVVRLLVGFSSAPSIGHERELLYWSLLSGLYIGVFYRWMAHALRREPTLWLAFAFPLLGALARTTAHVFLEQVNTLDLFLTFLANLFFGYIIGSWFVIPLGLLYLLVLRSVDRRLMRFSLNARWRGIRHMGWALGCAVLLLGVEGGRYFRQLGSDEIREIYAKLGFQPSSDWKLVRQSTSVALVYDGGEYPRYWFHSPNRITWPPVADAQPLASPEPRFDVEKRAMTMVGAPDIELAEIHQAKWYRDDSTVIGILVRTTGGDYVEIAP